MKITLLLLAAFSATILALPAGKSPDVSDLTIVPLEKGPYGQPIIDTGVIGGDDVEVGLFNDLFRNLAGIMSRMQQQIDSLFGRNRNGTTIENSDFPGLFVPNIDLSKGNTTSVTKKIDGHKVVINQTVYNGDDDGTFFNVRVVEVLPDSSEEKTDTATATTAAQVTVNNNENRDRESVENSDENEIKNPENEAEITMNFDNIETFDDIDSPSPSSWKELESLENFSDIDDNSIDTPAIDLNRDIYVNDIMADAGVPPNPDAEIFNPELLQPPSRPMRWRYQQPFEKLVQPR